MFSPYWQVLGWSDTICACLSWENAKKDKEGKYRNKTNQKKPCWTVIHAPKSEVREAHGCEMEGRKQKVSGDTAGSRDPPYNVTLSCAASLISKARMATSLLLCVQRNESQLDMLDRIVQTCKHSNSASKANSAVAYLVPQCLWF